MKFSCFDERPGGERAKAAGLYGLLLSLNLAAWVWAWALFAHQPALLGTAFLAFLLGLRHAVDADHIAAIDNVVRKLLQEGRRPQAAGFFFSLGHSSIVVLASALLASAIGLSRGRLEQFHEVGGILGTGISAFFLVSIGIANLFVLRGIWRVFLKTRRGDLSSLGELDGWLEGRGFLARIFKSVLNTVTQSRQMYWVGFLFGLGFDTATEVGLLAIAASQAAQGLSFGAVLVFPVLFTAGMALVDTTDSVLMTGAYGWALLEPLRKLWINLTLTFFSVLVALLIGSLEAFGLLADQFTFQGWFWTGVRTLNGDLSNFGFVIIGLFLGGWALSVGLYRFKRFEKTEPGL